MSFFLFAKILASIITGMLGIPLGILPSIFLFRDLANGLDDDKAAKRRYAWAFWGGMAVGWLLGSIIIWCVLNFLFG